MPHKTLNSGHDGDKKQGDDQNQNKLQFRHFICCNERFSFSDANNEPVMTDSTLK